MQFRISKDNLASILSCLSDNVNSFTRLPAIMEFLKENEFPKELESFVSVILNDCKRNLINIFSENYFQKSTETIQKT